MFESVYDLVRITIIKYLKMNDNLRFEISFKSIFELEKKLKFCLSNNIHKINIPCKGQIKKGFLNETIEFIGKNYTDLDIVYHYSLYHQYSKNREISYSNFLKFLNKSHFYKNCEILLVSGSNKKKNFEVIGLMNDLKKEKIFDLNIGIAYNPYLERHFTLSEEKDRFKKKCSTGLVSSIWLQFGTDIKILEQEIDFLKKYIKSHNLYYKNNNIKFFGSLLVPSRQFISRFKFRPWKGVYIAEKYLSSLENFIIFTKELSYFYLENDIQPVIETEFCSKEKLEDIYKLLEK